MFSVRSNPCNGETVENVLVNICEGRIRGKETRATTFSKRKYFAFQGIPYAQAPVGALRFRGPVPILPWDGVLDATKEGPSCPQQRVGSSKTFGKEDNCLTLHVYTPALPSAGAGRMPVMVWIHGGGFSSGSADTDTHDPDYWMRHDVVVVTCNYRLGALGFLSLGTPEVPGNAGLKDQVLVLRWVRRNIIYFSGDPQNVSLCGQSAGAACVHYHMLSPMSKGLFHRAIISSGSALSFWTFSANVTPSSYRLGQCLGKNTDDPQEMLHFLQSVPEFDLIKIQHKVITEKKKKGLGLFPFIPCVETKEGAGEKFLTEDPRSLLQKGLVAAVPLIIGINDREGMLVLNDIKPENDFEELENDFSCCVPDDLGLPVNAPEKIKNFFFKDKPVNWSSIEECFDYFGDVMMNLAMDDTVRFYLRSVSTLAFCYKFSFDGQFGMVSRGLRKMHPQRDLRGCCHTDDRGYVFKYNIPGVPEPKETPETALELQIVNLVTSMWYQFALTGNPNIAGQVTWEPAEKEGFGWRNYLEINLPLTTKNTRMEKNRMEFWDRLRGLSPQSNL